MHTPEAIDGGALDISNEYPELDVTPTYLWVGKAGDHPHSNINISPDEFSRQPKEIASDSLTEQELEKKNHDGAPDTTPSENNQENSWRQFSGDIDPDFESPDDCSTQVFSFLEM